ncbi:MAG: hypothetical protein RH860_14250 [Cytophagales bacterium]
MKKALLILAISLCIVFKSHAQENTVKGLQIAAMKKLEFLTGDWEGRGWISMGSEQKEEFLQTERVRFKTDGTSMLIEGLGKDAVTNAVTHDALAIVYFDVREKKYKFDSHVMQGYHGSYDAMVKQDTFIWKIENPYAGTMVYTITLNEKGQWFEIGERKKGDEELTQFFEMTLTKNKSQENE